MAYFSCAAIHQNFLNLAVSKCSRWLELGYVEGAGLEEE